MRFVIYYYSQKDFICFDFVPKHHNVIRYRKGVAVINDNFHTVCSWVQFKNEVQWKYSLFLGKIIKLLLIIFFY